jgi:hypothetical protein
MGHVSSPPVKSVRKLARRKIALLRFVTTASIRLRRKRQLGLLAVVAGVHR